MVADKERLLLKVFHDYYVRNLSQNDIAARHFISRQKVQRCLEMGRNQNLVEIRVKFPVRMHGTLESELEDKYGLLEAIIADVNEDDRLNNAMMLRTVSELASDYLLRILSHDSTISLTWSNHVAEMAEMAARKIDNRREKPRNVKIILTLGTVIGGEPDFQTLESSRRLSAALKGEVHLLLVPSLAASSSAHKSLMDDPRVADVMEMAKNSQVAFFGIGSIDGSSKCLNSVEPIMPEIVEKLRRAGVVGDINGYFFDRDGKQINPDFASNLIGLNIDDIKALPLSVGIASGRSKHQALKAALANRLLKVVVMDVDNAKRLMED